MTNQINASARTARQRKRGFGIERLEARHLLAANLVAHWNANDLDETVANNAIVEVWHDSQADIAATKSGEPRLVHDSVFGQSVVRFDPTDGIDSLRTSSSDSPMGGRLDFTVSVTFVTSQPLASSGMHWFDGTGLVDATVLNGITPSWGISLTDQGQVAAGVGNPASTIVSSTSGLNDGLAHLAVFRRLGDTISLSVDGAPFVTMSGASATVRSSTSPSFGKIGRGGHALNGDLADIRFYDAALTDEEALQLFDQIADKYIMPVYDPAVGVPDTYLVDAGEEFSVGLDKGVLVNEINIDELPLTARLVSPATAGTVVLNDDGSFSYDPENFTGVATFEYVLNDSVADQNVVTVTLNVDSVPEANDDLYILDEEAVLSPTSELGLLANDLDADGDSFTALLVDAPANGDLALELDGTFHYQPNLDFFGVDSFTYAIDDGDQVSRPATVTLFVNAINDTPVAIVDGYLVDANTTLNVIAVNEGLLSNDLDVDSELLTAMLVEGPENGTLTLRDDGTFDYAPALDFVGVDEFTYTVSDDELTSSPQRVGLYVDVAPVEISEFVVENHRSLRTRTRATVDDSFRGDPESYDWIEIHNRASTPFDLTGLSLSDNPAIPQKWTFPTATTIPGYGFLVVFASGLDLLDEQLDESSALHTNFKLSDDDEALLLTNLDGTPLAGFDEIPSQFPDVAYGVRNGEVGYFSPPTPGAENLNVLTGVLNHVAVDRERGFYEAPFQVQLTAASDATSIYYTLDGSQPTKESGQLYTDPIDVTSTTTLRALAYQEDYVPSPIVTHSYFLWDDVLQQPEDPAGFPEGWGPAGEADYAMDSRVIFDAESPYFDPNVKAALEALPSISVVMNTDDFFGSEVGIQSFPDRRGIDWERSTSVEFLDFEAFDDFQLDAGIRMVGNASRGVNRRKHNMRLAFRDDYGFSKLELPLFGLGDGEAHDNLILRGGNGDSWINPGVHLRAQYIRDQWQRDVQLAMGYETTHQLYAHLYINGLYWGLYHVFERHDASFMALNFGGDEEDYDAIKDVNGTSSVDAVSGSTQAWLDLMQMVDGPLTAAEKYSEVDQLVDLDNMIDYLLLNFYHGNNDWDHNNFRAGRHMDGKFVFFSWDAERADINSLQVGTNQIGPVDRDITGFSKQNRPTRIHSVLSASPEYRLRFADRMRQQMFHNGPLSPEGASGLWNLRADEIRLPLSAESARWGDLHAAGDRAMTVADWEGILAIMNDDFFPVRTQILFDQLSALYPSVIAPEFSQHGGSVANGFELEVSAEGAGQIWFTTDGSDPRAFGGDVSPTAQRFTVAVPLRLDSTIKTRVLENGEWSALTSATFIVEKTPADATNIRISEVHYHPGLPSAAEEAAGFNDPDDFEFIELVNIGDTTIDLSSVQLVRTDGIGVAFDFATSPIQALQPGERTVVVENQTAFTLRYEQVPVAGQWQGGLNNSSERLTLAAGGETVQEFSYDDGWHPLTDAVGFSLEVIDVTNDTADWNLSDNWRASEASGGTPGRSAVLGDFAGDGHVGPEDIELIHRQVRTGANSYSFDFNEDDLVDSKDFDEWLALTDILPGDANLDGQVDAVDLLIWADRSFTHDNGWGGADFNVDGVTDGSDFDIWNDHKFEQAESTLETRVARAPLDASDMAARAFRNAQARRRGR